nr:hypothetical protein [Cellulosimicrobium sp. MM]
MFAWARIPEPYRDMGSIEFATHLVEECDVAVSPGVGFGPAATSSCVRAHRERAPHRQASGPRGSPAGQ